MSVVGRAMTPKGVADTQRRMDYLMLLIEYVQTLIDAELKGLKLGVLRTNEDQVILDELASLGRTERRDVAGE